MTLLAAYNFDEGSGASAADLSGSGKTATATGSPWRASGHTLTGAGNSSAVAAGFTVPILGTNINAWTVELWMKADSATPPAALQSIMADASKYYFFVDTSGGLKFLGGTASLLAVDTNWHHIASSSDGTTITHYVDGAVVGTTGMQMFNAASVKSFANDLPMTTTGAFLGALDDLRIYDTARSGAQIITDMNTPVSGGPSPTTLVNASLSDYERDYYARRGISTMQSLEDMRLAYQGQAEYFYWSGKSGLGPGYSLADHKRKSMLTALSLSEPGPSNADLAIRYFAL